MCRVLARKRMRARAAFSSVLLIVFSGAGCKPSEAQSSIGLNRENARLANFVVPYFSGGYVTTNFVDMSNMERLATIDSLRKEARVGSKLLFFEISLSGQFASIPASENIDSQLASCALTPEEIARVKHHVTTSVDPHMMPPHLGNYKMEVGDKGPRSGNEHGVVLHSSQYDVYQVSNFRFDNTGTQEVYQAACCLILSPPGR
jgi:hypothetical protein